MLDTDDPAEALHRIRDARARGDSELSLAELHIRHLPDEIAGWTELRSLDLSGCGGLTDLAPLTHLTGLQSLCLDDCEGRVVALE